jgi:hypothetical protein
MADAEQEIIDADEIGAMIRAVAFHESRALAAVWGRSAEDMGIRRLLISYAAFLFHVTDLLAFGRHGDPWRLELMIAVRGRLRHDLTTTASAGDDAEDLFTDAFERPRIYDACKRIVGEDSIVLAATTYFAATLGRVDDEDRLLATTKNLTDAVVAILATPAFKHLS